MSIQVCNLVHPFIYISRLCPIELSSNENQAIAIIGGNGCGKTTFLRLLLKDLLPKHGTIIINNDIAFLGINNGLKPQVILKKQLPYFLNHNVTFPWPQFLHMKFQELSKGQQRLIALWITLQTLSPLILLDEPFIYLDSPSRNLVFEWINASIKLGKTIVFTSHSIDGLNTINNLKVLDLSF